MKPELLMRCATALLCSVLLAVTAGAADGEFRTRPDFRAMLTPIEVGNPLTEAFSGIAYFWLNEERTRLKYMIRLHGMDLIGFTGPGNPATDDVTKIHLHAGSMFGSHTLNIYKTPSQDDDDLEILPGKNMLRGIWDDSDEHIHARSPEHSSTVPLTTQLQNLCSDNLWVVLHGDGSVVENPGVFGDRVLAARIVAVDGSTACRR